MSKRDLGKLGEDTAKKYFENLGYKVITCNFYSSYGEIDIIAQEDKYIVFVEVRARKEDSIVTPAESVNKRKIDRILKTAYVYLKSNPTGLQPRFDIFEVFWDKAKKPDVKRVNYIKNAFYQEEEYAVF